ncbi:MAG TPA: GxxExxY protein [Gammaproteobacteria bacterium]|nr:GxxExxY protein [Gammaproteobacteria bacterium]
MDENALANELIGAAIEVHKHLGPGLMESAYQTCLSRELTLREISFETEVPVAVDYKGVAVEDAYRVDLMVGDKLIVELKAVASLSEIHKAQLLTYLRLTRRKLGILINFNEQLLKHGIQRVVNNL